MKKHRLGLKNFLFHSSNGEREKLIKACLQKSFEKLEVAGMIGELTALGLR